MSVAVDKRSSIAYETKTYHFEVKSVDEDQGIVTGYLNTKNNVDNQTDVTRDGAYKKTISDALSRKSNKGKKFLWGFLWMHDPMQPIGGFTDAQEDPKGLLTSIWCDITTNSAGIPNNPVATMVFSGLKSGYIDELSMGYKAIKVNYTNQEINGKTVNVRELLEVQIWEGSACTTLFAADSDAEITGVKSMVTIIEHKTVCGDTSLPIGPRDASWDGSEAEKQIFDYATNSDGEIDASKAKKCFLQLDGDDSLKGSYHYPFCNIVDGSPQINVGGVKACAGALAGGRGASTEGEDIAGMRAKVDTMYTRINKKYPDDPELSGTWNDTDKASKKPMQKKTFEEHYNEEQAEDLLEDWQDVLLCSLTCAVLDACKIGDTIESDVSDALTAFNKAVMDWVKLAQQYNLSQYLTDNSYSSADYTMQNGTSGWGYMSRRDKPARKAGARFSNDTKEQIQQHADDLKGMAADHKTLSDQLAAQYKTMTKAMKDHADALEKKASDLTDLWRNEGQGPAYADDPEDKDDKSSRTQDAQKSRREPPAQALTHDPNTQPGTLTEDEELKALEAALATNWKK